MSAADRPAAARHPAPRPRLGPGGARGRWTRYRPDVVLIEGPPEADALGRAGRSDGDGAAGGAARLPAARRRSEAVAGPPVPPRSGRSPSSRPSGRRCAGRWRTACRCGSWTCRWPTGSAVRPQAPMRTRRRRKRPTRRSRRPSPSGERVDPIGVLAEAAGYDDPERWWEDVVEHQRPAVGATTNSPRRWRRSRRSAWP